MQENQQEFRVGKQKYISLPDRYTKQLAEQFGVTRECVRQALHFNTNSAQAEAIRVRALEMQGFVTYKAV